MANLVKNFLGYLRLNDDEDDYEDYVEDFEDIPEIPKRTAKSQPRSIDSFSSAKPEKTTNIKQREEDSYKDRALRMERTTNNKIVPIRTTQRGLEVCIMKPASFEDSQDICDMLLGGRAVVVNLEGFDAEDSQRIMDFISGSVYAINGKLHPISRYIFIFSPDHIDISGDFQELMPEMGFDVPTINKEF